MDCYGTMIMISVMYSFYEAKELLWRVIIYWVGEMTIFTMGFRLIVYGDFM